MGTTANRESETRDSGSRVKSWRPASLLPDPNLSPGFVFRWIRVSSLGEADPTNLSSKLREGWEPVKAADYPELQISAATSGRFAGCVEVGGLLLCKTPKELVEQRNTYYEDITKQQMETVDNSYFKEFGPETTPFRERKSKVAKGFGSGKID